jgi:hypothetical protein
MGERRREARFDVQTGHGTMLSTTPVDIINISLGGLAFRTETRLRPKHYDVGFEFKQMADEDNARLARVVKALSGRR